MYEFSHKPLVLVGVHKVLIPPTSSAAAIANESAFGDIASAYNI